MNKNETPYNKAYGSWPKWLSKEISKSLNKLIRKFKMLVKKQQV